MDQWDYSSIRFSLCILELTVTLSNMLNVDYNDNEELDKAMQSFIYLYFIKYTKDNESIIATHIQNVDNYLTEYCKDPDQYSQISTDIDNLIDSTIKQHLTYFNVLNDNHLNSILNITFPEKYKVFIYVEAKMLKNNL